MAAVVDGVDGVVAGAVVDVAAVPPMAPLKQCQLQLPLFRPHAHVWFGQLIGWMCNELSITAR